MLLVALILALCGSVEALTAARGWAPAQMARSAAALRTAPVRAAPVMQFGKKKLSPEEKLEEMGYWPGEWLCADCGYIYEPGTSPPFEELRPGQESGCAPTVVTFMSRGHRRRSRSS